MAFSMEEYVYSIATSKKKQRKIGFIILGFLLEKLGKEIKIDLLMVLVILKMIS